MWPSCVMMFFDRDEAPAQVRLPQQYQTVEVRETLDSLILLGEAHLRRSLIAIEKHHNAARPHQGIGNLIPLAFDYPVEPAPPAEVECHEVLGGLLNHYSLTKAA